MDLMFDVYVLDGDTDQFRDHDRHKTDTLVGRPDHRSRIVHPRFADLEWRGGQAGHVEQCEVGIPI